MAEFIEKTTEFIGKTTEVDYTKEPDIDLKDRKILTVLSRNCRLTPIQIGRQVGLSKEVVTYRIKKLEKQGIIRGYITVMNPAKLGYQIYLIYLQTQSISQKKKEEFIEKLIQHPATHYIVNCMGKYDFIFDIFAPSIREFDVILRDLLREFGRFVKNYEIGPILDVPKYTHLTEAFSKDIKLNPIKIISDVSFIKELQYMKIDYKPSQIQLDNYDKAILSALSSNAKLQITKLAKKLHVSKEMIKYRIRKLIKKNIILGFLPIINISRIGYHMYGIPIELNNISAEEKEKIFQYLIAHPDVFLFVRTSGQYEITLNVGVQNNLHLYQFINSLNEKFPEQIKSIEITLFIKDYKMVFLK